MFMFELLNIIYYYHHRYYIGLSRRYFQLDGKEADVIGSSIQFYVETVKDIEITAILANNESLVMGTYYSYIIEFVI